MISLPEGRVNMAIPPHEHRENTRAERCSVSLTKRLRRYLLSRFHCDIVGKQQHVTTAPTAAVFPLLFCYGMQKEVRPTIRLGLDERRFLNDSRIGGQNELTTIFITSQLPGGKHEYGV
jgi:hypothetical protein